MSKKIKLSTFLPYTLINAANLSNIVNPAYVAFIRLILINISFKTKNQLHPAIKNLYSFQFL